MANKKKRHQKKMHERNQKEFKKVNPVEYHKNDFDPLVSMFGNLRIDQQNLPKLNCYDKKIANQKTSQTKPKGLSNLGNTCYLNSVMQVLTHTPLLCKIFEKRNSDQFCWDPPSYDYILHKFKTELHQIEYNNSNLSCENGLFTNNNNDTNGEIKNHDINTDESDAYDINYVTDHGNGSKFNDNHENELQNESITTSLEHVQEYKCKLEPPKLLVSCFTRLMHELRSNRGSQVISPNNFLREVTSVSKRFQGYDQQDSHEFLRCLLDIIKNDEAKRQMKTMLNVLKLSGKENVSENEKAKAKQFSDACKFTPVDAFFGGYCISSLKCEECENTSQIFEPFYDLSLPITEDRHYAQVGRKNKKNRNDSNEMNETPSSLCNEQANTNTSSMVNENRKLSRKEQRKRAKINKNICNDNRNVKQETFDMDEQTTSTTKMASLTELDKQPENGSEDEQEHQQYQQQPEQDKKHDDDKDDLLVQNENDTNLNELNGCPENMSDGGESSDDEASIKDANKDTGVEHLDDKSLSESTKDSSKQQSEGVEYGLSRLQRAQTNSTDSGINYPTLTSDGDGSSLKCKPDLVSQETMDETDVTRAATIDSPTINCCDLHTEAKADADEHTKLDSTNESNNEEETNSFEQNVDADCESDESNDTSASTSDTGVPPTHVINKSRANIELDSLFSIGADKRMRTYSREDSSDNEKEKARWILSTMSCKGDCMPSASILSCLSRFTSPELLGGANKINCDNCTQKHKRKTKQDKKIYTHASKRMLIAVPPPILTLHLKRFEVNSNHFNLCKVNRHVAFPLVFDLSPYVSNVYKVVSIVQNKQSKVNDQTCENAIIYSLYGIVEHSGGLRSGHYKAYVRQQAANEDTCLMNKFVHMTPYLPKLDELLDQIKREHIEHFECLDEQAQAENAYDYPDLEQLVQMAGQQNWYQISDSSVIPVSINTVLRAQAYLLFYERIY